MGIEDFVVLLDQAEKEVQEAMSDMLTAKGVLKAVFAKYLQECTNEFEEKVMSERMIEAGREALKESVVRCESA